MYILTKLYAFKRLKMITLIWGPIFHGDQMWWGPFVHGDQLSWGPIVFGDQMDWDHLSIGTKWLWGPSELRTKCVTSQWVTSPLIYNFRWEKDGGEWGQKGVRKTEMMAEKWGCNKIRRMREFQSQSTVPRSAVSKPTRLDIMWLLSLWSRTLLIFKADLKMG